MLHDSPLLEPRSYRLPDLEAVRAVFDAAFGAATKVKGAFGWFDAGWIGVLAYGLSNYLGRADTEPIEFTIAPALFSRERDALAAALSGDSAEHDNAMDALIAELERGASPQSAPVTRHAVRALCWLVVNDKLRLNIAFPKAGSNYHPKIWLFDDGVDTVVIRGSANATRRGMSAGIEHLDLDCSWRDRYRVAEYTAMVDDWAAGRDSMLLETVRLDLATLKQRVQTVVDENGFQLARPTRAELDDALEEEGHFEGTETPPTFSIPTKLKWREGPFSHQGDAVEAWEGAGRRGIFAIATGGGKTITALICAQRSYEQQVASGDRGPLILIVSVPSTPLIRQWESEMRDFGLDPLTPTLGTKAQRKEDLGNLMVTLGRDRAPDLIPIVVTNHRMSDRGFQRAIRAGLRRARRAGKDPYVLHIGDEAHSLGAPSFLENQPEFVRERLGLSATPIRQYDEEGSDQILRYFGSPELDDPGEGVVATFSLSDAIAAGALVPYDYHVAVVHLEGSEMERYRDLSRRIGQKIAQEGLDTTDDALTALLIQRRAILETAQGKITYLNQLLQEISTARMLLYTSSKNPEQFEAAHELLHSNGVSHHQVTQETTARPKLLQRALAEFTSGEVDCLIAKKVLDEGVNVPATRTAVLLASSTTEREWIQRLGRVLRTAEGKKRATIYDVVALPAVEEHVLADTTSQTLVRKELERVRRIAQSSQTLPEVLQLAWELEEQYLGTESGI